MAALSNVELVKRMPIGDRYLMVFRATTNASPNQADEWIATGLSDIDAVLGSTPIGTAAVADDGAAPIAAQYTLDMTGDTPGDTDTITIDGVTYTLNATVGTTRHSIDHNATPATQAANIVAAMNGTGTPGTEYSIDTPPNPRFSAAVASDTVVFTHRAPGTVGNGVSVSTDITGATFTQTTTGVDGGAAVAPGLNFVENARGTGVTEDTNRGDLGVESSAASTVFEVTIIGRP